MIEASVYVHVPFCVVKCGYCDFTSYVPDGEDQLDVFLAMLDRELALATVPQHPSSVFLGGGTPTFLDAERFARLFAILGRHIDLKGCPEVTVEANPESVTPEKAAIAAEAGVDRISIGAQSFAADALRFLDRAHDAERTARAFAIFRDAGFDNVSLDLMFGLPGQTLAQWDADLAAALRLRPDHLSCYNLTFEPGTKLHHEMTQGRVEPNDDRVDRAMFDHTRTVLHAAGFDAYEISNFAGRGGPCRHNDHYWLQGDYVGVGPSASSHRGGTRWTSFKPIDRWARSIADGVPPVASAETLTRDEQAGEAIWLGLRRTAGVDLAAVEARVDVPLRERFAEPIEAGETAGLLEIVDGRLRLTPAGLIQADAVGATFLVARET
jgi:oxygen-independent coproporphyrinogen-3 oxidase